jgi:hypothetical protein
LWRCGRNTGVLRGAEADDVHRILGRDGGLLTRIAQAGDVGRILYLILYLDGAAGRGDVGVGFRDESPGLFVDVADELGGAADDAEAAGVGGGEREAIEEGVGLFGVDAVGGEGVEDTGDGELGGLAVLDGGELEEAGMGQLGGLEVDLVAVETVAVMQAAVEVTEDGIVDGDSAALQAVGLDVAADGNVHFALLNGPPPGGWWLKVEWMQSVSEMDFAKYMHPSWLQ